MQYTGFGIKRSINALGIMLLAGWTYAETFEELPQSEDYLKWLNRKTTQVKVGGGNDYSVDGGWVPICADMSFLTNSCTSSYNPTKAGSAKAGNAIPVSYDARARGFVTPVKNQGSYGTCWAHAAMASLESWVLMSDGVSMDFSENNLANLHGFKWDFTSGGNGHLATAYFLRWGGPVLESQDPYPNWGGSKAMTPARHVQEVRYIPQRTTLTDNDLLKTAIIEYGAIMVCYYEDGSSSPYYKAGTGSMYCPLSYSANHAVTLVGWDDTYSRLNFSTKPPGDGAFIVKNSWGASSRKNGYFYISYYDKTLCKSCSYAFPSAEKNSNYDAIYHYDPYGQCTAYGARYGANLFVATGNQTLSAVGFYALAPNTTYEIEIYSGCQQGAPRSGTKKHSQTGVTTGDFAGYFTIPLSQNIWLTKGERFSVVIHFVSTPGCSYPLAAEKYVSSYAVNATASAGESFCSSDGEKWTDLTTVSSTANFCCKAYANTRKNKYVDEVLPEEYTLYFEANGGVGTMAPMTYRYDAAQKILPKNTFTRVGYKFLGWSLDQNGKYAQREDQSDVSFCRTYWGTSYTLFAIWQPISYDVRLNFDDPTLRNPTDVIKKTGSLLIDAKQVTRQFTYDTISSLPRCSDLGWSKARYSFKGWSIEPGGDVCYRDGQGILNLLTKDGGIVDLYTTWDHTGNVSHAIVTGHYCVTGGTVPSGEYHCQLRFDDDSWEWVTAQWSVVSGGDIASIDSSGKLTAAEVSVVKRVIIKAECAYRDVWYTKEYEIFIFPKGHALVSPYRISFDPGGASIKTSTVLEMLCERDVVYRLALPAGGMSNPGKRLAGWQCSNGRRYDPGVLLFNLGKSDETVTMTAIWQ